MKTFFPIIRQLAAAIVIFAAILLSGKGLADIALQEISHRRNVLPGARSALLAGAFTALSDDSSGLYYNPAGISFATRKQESIAILYSEYAQMTSYEGAIGDEAFTEKSNSRFASISGGIFKNSAFTFGYAFLTLDNRSINQNDQFSPPAGTNGSGGYSRMHLENINFTLAGGGVAYRIAREFSVGLSGFHFQRRNELMDFQLTRTEAGGISSLTSKSETRNEGLLPIVGTVFRNDWLATGLSCQLTYVTTSKSRVNQIAASSGDGAGAGSFETLTYDPTIFNEPRVNTYSWGSALFLGRAFMIAADVLYHQVLEAPAAMNDTLNFSAGMELTLGPLRGSYGVFTNNSLFPPVEDGRSNQSAHVNFLGQSYGLTLLADDFDVAFGSNLQKGVGKAQVVLDDPSIQEVRSESTVYFVAANYRF